MYNLIATNAMFHAQGLTEIPDKVLPMKWLVSQQADMNWVINFHKEINNRTSPNRAPSHHHLAILAPRHAQVGDRYLGWHVEGSLR